MEEFTCISLLPFKVDVLRMKKLYNSEMNSTHFCWPERNAEIHLSNKVLIERDSVPQMLKVTKYLLPQPQSSNLTHTPYYIYVPRELRKSSEN